MTGGVRRGNLSSLAAAGAIAAAVFAANVFTCGIGWRLDVTASGRYSPPRDAAGLLAELPDLVVATAYFSNVPPPLAEARAQVEEVLAEYRHLSAGELDWRAADPGQEPGLAEKLAEGGIAPLGVVERGVDQRTWFAVRFEFRGQHIDWTPLDPAIAAETAAADFADLLRRLIRGRPRVGITRGFGEVHETRALTDPALGFANLYDVAPIDWDRRADAAYLDDIDVLVVNGPTEPVSGDALALLDAFLMSGRPVVFLVRGIRWSREELPAAMSGGDGKVAFTGSPSQHQLDGLLAHLGFRVGHDTVLDEEGAPGLIPVGRLSWRTPLYFPIGRPTGPGRPILSGLASAPIPFASTIEIITPGQATPILVAGPSARVVPGGARLTEGALSQGEGGADGQGVPIDAANASIALAAIAEGSFAHDEDAVAGPALGAQVPSRSPAGTRIAVVGTSVLIEDSLFAMMEQAGEPAFWSSFVLFDRLLAWALRDPATTNRVVDLRPLPPGAEEAATRARWAIAGGVPLTASGLWLICAWAAGKRRRKEQGRWLRPDS